MLWIQYWVVGVNHDGEDVLMQARSTESVVPVNFDTKLSSWHSLAIEEAQPHYQAYQFWINDCPLTKLTSLYGY